MIPYVTDRSSRYLAPLLLSYSFPLPSIFASSSHSLAPRRSVIVVSRRYRSSAAGTPHAPPLPPPPRSLHTPVRGRAGTTLPPPPPLVSSRLGPANGAGTIHNAGLQQRSPQEIASIFTLYVPTFYVSLQCAASLFPEEIREQFLGRGRLLNFFRRHPFVFEVTGGEHGHFNVRLHPDLNHPQRGAADEKYTMSDVGETVNYVAKPEYLQSTENIESRAVTRVLLRPSGPPPAVRVQLEERVPVVDRLRSLVPVDFTPIETLEESIPEDILFHPYFDCQGGLLSIASKIPEEVQVVEGQIRRRPSHLAPLALAEFTLADSPFPEVAMLVAQHVCDSDIPHWVSITALYELLTREQKRDVKRHFKSFAGFLRVHGQALAVSTDMLQVSMWRSASLPSAAVPARPAGQQVVSEALPSDSAATPSPSSTQSECAPGTLPPSPSLSTPTETSAATPDEPRPVLYSREQVLNTWYDCFPADRTLNLREAMQLLPVEMRSSNLPAKLAPWLASHPQYFTVDFAEAEDPTKVLLRRASHRQPLDLAAVLYPHLPSKGVPFPASQVLPQLDPVVRRVIEGVGLPQLGLLLPQWLEITEGRTADPRADGRTRLEYTIRRLQDAENLHEEVQRRSDATAAARRRQGTDNTNSEEGNV